jgi:hypothetical protein
MSKVSGVPFERPQVHDVFVPFTEADSALIGPLRKVGDNLQVQRNNLAIKPQETERSVSLDSVDLNLNTFTLLGLSPGGDIGVLYNQTLNLPTDQVELAKFNEKLEKELREVLRSRAWSGLTLKRTVDLAGSVTYEFFNVPSSQESKASIDRSSLPGVNSNGEIAVIQDGTFDITGSRLLSDENFCFRPIPALYPGADTDDKIYTQRTLQYERGSGTLPSSLGDYRRAELVLSQIGAFESTPFRQTFASPPDLTTCNQRPFQPKSLAVTYGAVKQGEMISHRCQAIYGGTSHQSNTVQGDAESNMRIDQTKVLYTPAASVSLRHKAGLPTASTPKITDLNATARTIFIDSATLVSHMSLDMKWNVLSQPLDIDSESRPLLVPDGDVFITYDEVKKYDFKDNNRRLFALLTLIDGELREVPEYSKNDGQLIRKDNGDSTLPFQVADHNAPAIYLVTRIPQLDQSRSINAVTFWPQFVNGDHLSSTKCVPFGKLFELDSEISVEGVTYYVWNAVTNDWWQASGKLALVWSNRNPDPNSPNVTEPVVLCPWSMQEKLISKIDCLNLRVLRTGESQTHLVVSKAGEHNTVLSFEKADGEHIRHASKLALSAADKRIDATFEEKYSAFVQTIVAVNDRVQLVTTLAGGVSIAADAQVGSANAEVELRQGQSSTSSSRLSLKRSLE